MNLKRILTLLLVIFSIFLLSCAEKPDEGDIPEGYALADNEGSPFWFYYPEGWIMSMNDPGMIYVYASATDKTSLSVSTFTAPNDIKSLEQYIKESYFVEFESNFKNLEPEKDENGNIKFETGTIDGFESISVVYTAEFSKTQFKFKTCLISRGTYIHAVTYTAECSKDNDKYSEHLSEANKMISYVHFK